MSNFRGVRDTVTRRHLDNISLNTNQVDILEINLAYNVRTWGAKGDGVTDDTPSFQQLLNSGNSFAYVPTGTYVITQSLIIPTNKILVGFGNSVILDFNNSSADFKCIILNERSILQNLTIKYSGTNNTTSSGVYIGDVNTCRIVNVAFDFVQPPGVGNYLAYGLYMKGGVTACSIINGIFVGGIAAALLDGTGNFIGLNLFTSNAFLTPLPVTSIIISINAIRNSFVNTLLANFDTATNGFDFDATSQENNIFGILYPFVITNIINEAVVGSNGYIYDGIMNIPDVINIRGLQVLSQRIPGWTGIYTNTVGTPAGRRALNMDSVAAVDPELKNVIDILSQLIYDLKTHGMIAT